MLDFDNMSREELVDICKRFRNYIEYNVDRANDKDELIKKIKADREDGLSMAKIGQKYGISRQRVHQLLGSSEGK